MKFLRRGAVVGLATLATPLAHAHLVTSGLGPFYDGIGHFVLSPESWLAAAAVALFAGLQAEKSATRLVLGLLPACWLIGGGIGMQLGEVPATVSAVLLLVLGVLVAMGGRGGKSGVVAVAALGGLIQGASDGGGLAAGRAPWVALLGTIAAIAVITPLLAASVVAAKPAWMRLGVRVAGSWIAATGLLLLGWAWRGHFR